MTNLIVLSHSLQAKRMRMLLENPAASALHSELVGNSEIVFLEWGESYPHSPEWAFLQNQLGGAPILRYALPRHPNVLTNVTKKFHVSRYRKILDARPHLARIVFFSYHSHYAYLAGMAKARGIKLVLVEEGLSTFRSLVPQKETTEPGGLTQTLHLLYWLARDLAGALLAFTQGLVAIARPQFSEVAPFPQGYRAFDSVYSHFPNVVGSIFTRSNIQDLSAGADSRSEQPFNSGVGVFIGQTYELSPAAMDILLREMLRRAGGQIFVLLHPRSSARVKSAFAKAIAESGTHRVGIDDSGRSAEQLIKDLRPQYVFSLTSTVLLEARLWVEKTEPVSLAENVLDKRCGLRRRVKKTISEGYLLIQAFQSFESMG